MAIGSDGRLLNPITVCEYCGKEMDKVWVENDYYYKCDCPISKEVLKQEKNINTLKVRLNEAEKELKDIKDMGLYRSELRALNKRFGRG